MASPAMDVPNLRIRTRRKGNDPVPTIQYAQLLETDGRLPVMQKSPIVPVAHGGHAGAARASCLVSKSQTQRAARVPYGHFVDGKRPCATGRKTANRLQRYAARRLLLARRLVATLEKRNNRNMTLRSVVRLRRRLTATKTEIMPPKPVEPHARLTPTASDPTAKVDPEVKLVRGVESRSTTFPKEGGPQCSLTTLKTVTAPVGGRVQQFHDNWTTLTSDKIVLDIVRRGYRLPFETRPVLIHTPPFQRMSREKEAVWEPVIQRMLDMDAIEEVIDMNSGGIYSSVFLRVKPNGTFRPIINLKALNAHLKALSFSMATPKKVLEALAPGVYSTSVDLKDAYFHVPMALPHRKYLRFAILSRVFQFKTLPFGLSPAPRIFTLLVTVLLKWCHRNGINMIPYLDDWLLYNTDRKLLQQHTSQVVQMAGSLGWVINFEKSDLIPSQQFEFLGMSLDTVKGTVTPCPRRVDNMLSRVQALPSATHVSKKSLLQLQGTMVSLGDLVKLGKLRRRPFQQVVRALDLHKGLNTVIPTTPDLKKSVEWWSIRRHLTTPVSYLKNRETVTVVTDASTVGWGATVMDTPLRGVWSEPERRLHINCLEMLAVLRVLQLSPGSLRHKHMSLHTDNMTVRSYLLKQGGTVSSILNRYTEMVWRALVELNVTLSVAHISGCLNVLADKLSRPGQILPGEWSLCKETFLALTQVWGVPSIDLFATKFNAQLPSYVSPCPDSQSTHQDALSLDWDQLPALPYCFPPFKLILATLEHVKSSNLRECILVAPAWPGNPFFPLLMQLSIDHPVYLGGGRTLLSQGVEGQIKLYPTPQELGLHAWLVSSSRSDPKDSPRRWRPSPPPRNARLLEAGTTKYGLASVLGWKAPGVPILSRPLHPR